MSKGYNRGGVYAGIQKDGQLGAIRLSVCPYHIRMGKESGLSVFMNAFFLCRQHCTGGSDGYRQEGRGATRITCFGRVGLDNGRGSTLRFRRSRSGRY